MNALRVRVLPPVSPWLLAPPKKPPKPPANDNRKHPRAGKRHVHFCSICGEAGHNRRSCPKLKGRS